MDSPASSKRGADSDTEDEDFNAADLSDASDADETDPAILDREDLSGIDIHKDKRPKFGLGLDGQLPDGAPLAPIRPTGPVYTNPLPIPIPSNQPPHPRYELARSPTPPDIANTRKDLL